MENNPFKAGDKIYRVVNSEAGLEVMEATVQSTTEHVCYLTNGQCGGWYAYYASRQEAIENYKQELVEDLEDIQIQLKQLAKLGGVANVAEDR